MKGERESLLTPLLWACLIVLLASIPYIAGLWLTPGDGVFTGFTYNIDDSCVYSSWVRQVADGHLLLRNLYTSEPQHALQFNLLFLVLGFIARITTLSPAAVLHMARIGLGIGLLVLVWKFSRRFLASPLERSLVIPIVGLSSGLGWLIPAVAGHMGPVDLWQPEAITFLSIYLNPLFLAGMILMVATLHFLYRMKETGAWKFSALAGLMLLLLANIHTYDVLTVGAVWSAYLVAKIVKNRRMPWKLVGQTAAAATISIPALAYQFYLYSSESVFRTRVESGAPSPALWAYLAGYGLVLVLAAVGALLALRERRGALVLVVWSVVGFALPYVPVAQQRKLVMGLHLPLAILATIALAALLKRLDRRTASLAAALAVAVLVMSNARFVSRDVSNLHDLTTQPMYPAYLSNSQMAALEWLRTNTKPGDVILATREFSLFVPPVAGRPVYFGHWSETPDFQTKYRESLQFSDALTSDSWRLEFLQRTGAKYIVYYSSGGERIPLPGGGSMVLFDLHNSSLDLRQVFMSGDTTIFKVNP